MAKFTTPTDGKTAIVFLTELADAGLLFHPEDTAADCLGHHNLPVEVLDEIERNRLATFDHLDDPCEIALELLDRE